MRHLLCLSLIVGSRNQNPYTTRRSGASESSSEIQQLRHEREPLIVHGRNMKTETLACPIAIQPWTSRARKGSRGRRTLRTSNAQTRRETQYRAAGLHYARSQCGLDPEAYVGSTDSGFMEHMEHGHGRQPLIQESVAQFRQMDRAACVTGGTVRSRRGNRCNHCTADIATRDTLVGDIFQDRRQSGHQDAAANQSNPHRWPVSSQPIPQGDLPDDSPLPNNPIRDIVLTDHHKQLLADLRRASAMAIPRCVVSRYAIAWADSLKGAVSGHQS